ncbi:MAG: class I adenylate-forming enzyme family protein [Solirubrobacteraceae bacterium]
MADPLLRVTDLLDLSARRYPDRVAVADERSTLTYAAYRERTVQVANALLDDGLAGGDRVGVLLANSMEYAEVIFGMARAGVIAAHLSFRSSPSELCNLLLDSNARTLVYDAEFAEDVAALLALGEWVPELPLVRVGDEDGVEARSYPTWRDAASAKDPPPSTEPVFYLGYTSGTTGRPKGARITQTSRVLTAIAACTEYQLGPDDANLMFTPMHHGGPLVFVLAPAVAGGRLVIMRRFDPEIAWETIEKEGITNAFVVPTILGRLAQARDGAGTAPPSLRVLVSNAAPLPTPTKEAILRAAPGLSLHEFYGSTEAGIVTNLRPEDQLRKVRCAGQPLLLTEVEIRGPGGEVLPPGEVGELFSRSPFLFDGYHDRPEATAEALVDGWVTAGDLARTDEEGYVYIVDRKKDLIISGGVNIYPLEIEAALLAREEIAEAAVIGIPDPDWGERIKAYVVLVDAQADASALVAAAVADMAAYKRPREVEACTELPRNSTGKLLRRVLRDREWEGHEAQI